MPLVSSSSLPAGEARTFWERFRVAQLEQSTNLRLAQAETSSQRSAAGLARSDASSSNLEEIIVTAQKRSERLQDVPVPVTAVSAEALVSNNQLRLQDYYTSVPGFMVAPTSKQTSQFLAIRGASTGQGSPSVGVVIDDLPYGSSTFLGGGQGVPDIDPGDLARVEVLRGPQGTLYGASSLGGSGEVRDRRSVHGCSKRTVPGRHEQRSPRRHAGIQRAWSINVPLSDTFAIRASAFTRLEPGYIDNPVRNIDGIDEETSKGARLSALWRPSQSVSLKLGAIYQESELDGVHSVDVRPDLAELEQAYALDTSNEIESQAYSAILTAELGASTLTSLTGYNISSFHDQQDVTDQFGPFTQLLFGVSGTGLASAAETKKFSQELRLAMPLGEKFEWLVGGYYSKEDTEFSVDFLAVDEANQQTAGAYVYIGFSFDV